ncbi:MAG: S-layer homology domain-containing protein [Acidobacteriota bacterium]
MTFRAGFYKKNLRDGHKKARIGLTVALCVILVFGIIIPGNAASFKDLNANISIYPFAAYLSAKNIMGGYPDGTFHAERTFTRAQMVVLLCKVKCLNTNQPQPISFKDVKTSHWAYKYIGAAVKAGLVTGYPGGYFRPDAPVTRAEVAAMLISLTSEETPILSLPTNISDVSQSHWARKQIAAVIDAGFVPPLSYAGFAPDSPAKRGQVAQGLAMLLTTASEYITVPLSTTLVKLNGEVSLTDNQGQAKSITGSAACKVGDTIKTGASGEAEIQFPDGSSILMEPSSVLKIVSTSGQAVIKANGDPGTAVDFAEFELPQGRIFGVLASNSDPSGDAAEYDVGAGQQNTNSNLFAASSQSEKAKKAWWKKAASSRVRIKIDMPWTVAGIRGTVWMNEVSASAQTVSVVEGAVNVSAGAGAVNVEEGQYSVVAGSGRQPDAPKPLTLGERKKWNASKDWLSRSLNRIKLNVPLNMKRPIVSEQVLRIESRFEDLMANTDGPNEIQSPQDQTSSGTKYIQSVQITGVPAAGATLTGNVNLAAMTVKPQGKFVYKWYIGLNQDGSDKTPIANANRLEYAVKSTDLEHYIFFEASFQNSEGDITETALSSPVGSSKEAQPVIQSVQISGEPYTTAVLAGSASYDRTALSKGAIIYKWYSDLKPDGINRVPIENATGSQYTLSANDVGRYMFLEAAFQTSSGKVTERVISNSIGPIRQLPQVIQSVQISGEPVTGSILSGSVTYSTRATPDGTITYKWYRGSTTDGSDKTLIPDATGIQYTLTSLDVNQYVFLEVTVSKSGISQSMQSSPKGPVRVLLKVPTGTVPLAPIIRR